MNINKIVLKSLLLLLFVTFCNAQVASPYKTSWKKDGIWVAATTGLNIYGLSKIKAKEDITLEELNSLNSDDVFFLDRFAAGNYDENAYKISDLGFAGSFAIPFLLAIDKDTRAHSGQLSLLLYESLSTASAVFTVTAGIVDRTRPKVYNENLSEYKRLSAQAQRSFFSGHVAASASATFFTAQVYSDFFPNSNAKPYIWAGAATIPAVVGYFRIKAGEHFLSDVIIGYIIGGASGILIPTLHKNKERKLNITSGVGFNYQTVGVNYTF